MSLPRHRRWRNLCRRVGVNAILGTSGDGVRLQSVSLRNIKCYEETDLSFSDGVTVVMGSNGSGKSSLLEACFAGIYGSKAGEADLVLADMITTGRERGSIVLEFSHLGDLYRTEHEFRITDSDKNRALTSKATLSINGGDEHFDGARRVREEVIRRLHMDEEAFVNCVYVRQGEVNKLINASPAERQRMIDELLQLGRLEEYRERAVEARRGVGRVLDEAKAEEKVLREEIDQIDEPELRRREKEAREIARQANERISQLQEKRDQALGRRREIEEKIGRLEEKQQDCEALKVELQRIQRELGEIEQQIRSLREKKVELLEDRDQLMEQTADLGDIKSDLKNAESREGDLREAVAAKRVQVEGQSQTLQARQDEVLDRQGELDSRIRELERLEKDLADRDSQIEEQNRILDVAHAELDDLLGQIAKDAPGLDGAEQFESQIRERVLGVRAELNTLSNSIERQRDLMSKGLCPTCGQDLRGSSVEKTLENEETCAAELREQLSGLEGDLEGAKARVKLARAQKEILEKIESIKGEVVTHEKLRDTYVENLEDLKARKKSLEMEVVALQERVGFLRSSVEELKSALNAENESLVGLKEDLEKASADLFRLRELSEALDRANILAGEAERLDERIRSIHQLSDVKRQMIADKRARLEEIMADIGSTDQEDLLRSKETIKLVIEKIESDIKSQDESLTEIKGELGRIKGEHSRLGSLRERLDAAQIRRAYLDSLHAEANTLADLYGELRAELRGRNVDALGQLLNEIFSLVYLNDSYSGIQLDPDYELTVYQKDGTPLHPRLLSGGERALFNLSLRCAIYRLLTGAQTSLPPLILDEPTVYLDRGHVSQLIKLIETMRDLGAEQIIVVSHDEALIDAADRIIKVEKDPLTNRSRAIG